MQYVMLFDFNIQQVFTLIKLYHDNRGEIKYLLEHALYISLETLEDCLYWVKPMVHLVQYPVYYQQLSRAFREVHQEGIMTISVPSCYSLPSARGILYL